MINPRHPALGPDRPLPDAVQKERDELARLRGDTVSDKRDPLIAATTPPPAERSISTFTLGELFSTWADRQSKKQVVIRTKEIRIKLSTPLLSEDAQKVVFMYDPKTVELFFTHESDLLLEYNGGSQPVVFFGGDISFPGLPFNIISFFKKVEEPK